MAGDGCVTCSVCRPNQLDYSRVGISTLDTILGDSRVFVSANVLYGKQSLSRIHTSYMRISTGRNGTLVAILAIPT